MNAKKIITVLIVEDSPVIRELLVHIFSQDPEFNVIGTAADGEQAIAMTQSKRPDVITMDLHMPRMDGIEAVRLIMESVPTPIVIVSGSSEQTEIAETFRALEAGALAVVEKPVGANHSRVHEINDKLRQTVKIMSEVRVVRRWPKRAVPSAVVRSQPAQKNSSKDVQLIVIGASTGGPQVLQTILCGLHNKLSVPVVIVQHIANGFTQGFADWLTQSTGVPVAVAKNGEVMVPGRVYLGAEECHIEVRAGICVKLCNSAPQNGHRPSVAPLFRSAATMFGANVVGVLLSGMGHDGAEELKLLHDNGAFTIAQDLSTAVVPSMPGEAIRLGAVDLVLTPERIAAELIKKIPPLAAQ